MKNLFLMLWLMEISNLMHADWKLNAIYNESDLHLDGAYRLKNGTHKSTFIEKKIKNAKPKSVMMLDYKVVTDAKSQGYLCISLHDQQNATYELCFDSQVSHAITWQRSKTTKITLNDKDVIDDTLHYARVFLKKQGNNIVKTKHGYNSDSNDVALDLIIRGVIGNYTLKLDEVVR